MRMRSPSRTKAIGPPSAASGATWPMQNPHVPPEKRPSVIEGAVGAAPGALERPGDGQHLAHPRPALRSLVADHEHGARHDRRRRGSRPSPRPRRRRPGPAPSNVQLLGGQPGDLDDRAERGQRAGEHVDAALGVDRRVERVDDDAVGARRVERGEVLGHRLAGDREARRRASRPASSRWLSTTGTPPTRSRSLMWNLPPGFMSAMCGTRAAMRLKSSRVSVDLGLVGDGQQVQHGVRRAAERRRDGDGVLERRLGHDLARRDAEPQHLARPRHRRRGRRRGGGRRSAGGDAEPGMLMPSASPIELIVLAVNMPPHAPSPGHALRSIAAQLVVVDRADGAGADRLEHAGDVDRRAVVLAGHDRAVVDEHAGQVEAGRRHQHRRHATCRSRPGRRSRRDARRTPPSRPSR